MILGPTGAKQLPVCVRYMTDRNAIGQSNNETRDLSIASLVTYHFDIIPHKVQQIDSKILQRISGAVHALLHDKLVDY